MVIPLSHKIHLFKEKKEINCAVNNNILEAALANGINHTHACGGQGKCSTCRVSIVKGIENCSTRNETEQKIANRFNFPEEVRLACQTKIRGDVAIRRMVADKFDEELVNEHFSNNSRTSLGSQQKIAIVFTDIVNYTAFAEKFPPYDVVHVLNRYYRVMDKIIQYNNGIISNLTDDGILAVFGINNKSENPVLDAIHAVNGMNEKLKQFNQYLKENFDTAFEIRAGLHYGNVILGSINTNFIKKMILIGDNVNYASRIEAANKKFNTKFLLSETAYEAVKEEYPNYNLFTTSLKGKTGLYNLYEISAKERFSHRETNSSNRSIHKIKTIFRQNNLMRG